jgi:hypothetical protein
MTYVAYVTEHATLCWPIIFAGMTLHLVGAVRKFG